MVGGAEVTMVGGVEVTMATKETGSAGRSPDRVTDLLLSNPSKRRRVYRRQRRKRMLFQQRRTPFQLINFLSPPMH